MRRIGRSPDIYRLSIILWTPGTGGIRLKATFDNRDGAAVAGAVRECRADAGHDPERDRVPSEAVQDGQKGLFVYVVKTDQTVEPRVVETGRSVGPKTVIESGVAPGDTVVTDGHLRLFPGAKIQPVDLNKLDGGKS